MDILSDQRHNKYIEPVSNFKQPQYIFKIFLFRCLSIQKLP